VALLDFEPEKGEAVRCTNYQNQTEITLSAYRLTVTLIYSSVDKRINNCVKFSIGISFLIEADDPVTVVPGACSLHVYGQFEGPTEQKTCLKSMLLARVSRTVIPS